MDAPALPPTGPVPASRLGLILNYCMVVTGLALLAAYGIWWDSRFRPAWIVPCVLVALVGSMLLGMMIHDFVSLFDKRGIAPDEEEVAALDEQARSRLKQPLGILTVAWEDGMFFASMLMASIPETRNLALASGVVVFSVAHIGYGPVHVFIRLVTESIIIFAILPECGLLTTAAAHVLNDYCAYYLYGYFLRKDEERARLEAAQPKRGEGKKRRRQRRLGR